MPILPDIEKFMRLRNMTPTRFGRDAVRDPRFVLDLRNGREPRERTVKRLRAFMSDKTGDDA